MDQELAFRIVLEEPPSGVDFALQKGKGTSYEIIQKQRSGSKELCFEFTARPAPGAKSGEMRLHGPFIQGPPGARFVYVGIGAFAGQTGGWSRRLKVPLNGVTAEMVSQVQKDPRLIFETRVPGTGKDGGPNCATVKPFAGWKLVRSPRK